MKTALRKSLLAGLIGLSLLFGFLILSLQWLNGASGQSWLIGRIGKIEISSGMRVEISSISGSLWSKMRLQDIRLHDLKGSFATIDHVELTWEPLALLSGKLLINTITMGPSQLLRQLQLRETTGSIIPDQDLEIRAFHLSRLHIFPLSKDKEQLLVSCNASLTTGEGHLKSLVRIMTEREERLLIHLDIDPKTDRMVLDSDILLQAQSAFADYISLREDVSIRLAGTGSTKKWNGRLSAMIASMPALELALSQSEGMWDVKGKSFDIRWGKQRLRSNGLIGVSGHLDDKQLRFDGHFQSRIGLNLRTQGGLNFKSNRFLPTKVQLLGQSLRYDNMELSGIDLMTRLEGVATNPSIVLNGTVEQYRQGDLNLREIAIQADLPDFSDRITRGQAGQLKIQLASVRGLSPEIDFLLKDLEIESPVYRRDSTINITSFKIKGPALEATGKMSIAQAIKAHVQGRLIKVPTRIDPRPQTARFKLDLHMNADSKYLNSGRLFLQGEHWAFENQYLSKLFGRSPTLSVDLKQAGTSYRIRNIQLQSDHLRIEGQTSIKAGNRLDGVINARVDDLTALGIDGLYSDSIEARMQLSGKLDQPMPVVAIRTKELAFSGMSFQNMVLDAVRRKEHFAINARSDSNYGALTLQGDLDPQTHAAKIDARLGNNWAKGRLALKNAGLDGLLNLRIDPGMLGEARLVPDNQGQRIVIALAGKGIRSDNYAAPVAIARGKLDLDLVMTGDGLKGNGLFRLTNSVIGSTIIDKSELIYKSDGGQGNINFRMTGERGQDYRILSQIKQENGAWLADLNGRFGKRTIKTVQPAKISYSSNKKSWVLEPVKIAVGEGSLRASGLWSNQGQTRIRGQINQLPLWFLQAVNPTVELDGRINGSLSYQRSKGKRPTMMVDLNVLKLRRRGLSRRIVPLDMRISLFLAEDQAAVDMALNQSKMQIGTSRIRLNNIIYRRSESVFDSLLDGRLSGNLVWDGPAEAMAPLIDLQDNSLTGPLKIKAALEGKLGDPNARGQINAKALRLENQNIGFKFSDILIQGSFIGSQVQFQRFEGRSGKHGRLSVSGAVDLSLERGFPADLSVTLDKVLLLRRDTITARSSGALRLISGPNEKKISGSLLFGKVIIHPQPSAIEEIPQVAVYEKNTELVHRIIEKRRKNTPMELDIVLTSHNQIKVDGLGLKSNWGGKIDITGTTTTPRLKGQLSIYNGNYDFAGRRFPIDRGEIVFSNERIINPSVNIKASTAIDNMIAEILITGRSDRPQISFTSKPFLPQEELMSRILFGSDSEKLSPFDAIKLANALAMLKSGNVGDYNIIGKVEKTIGVDRIRMLPPEPTYNIGTSVALGKYFGRRVYVEAATDGSRYAHSLVEYNITRSLTLLAKIGALRQSKGELRWSKDY